MGTKAVEYEAIKVCTVCSGDDGDGDDGDDSTVIEWEYGKESSAGDFQRCSRISHENGKK
jgi:hypothetical protein